MDAKVVRGAAAALVALTGALPAAAQLPATGRPADTGTVRVIVSGRSLSADSIAVLLRAFDQEPLGSAALVAIRDELDRVMSELRGTMAFGPPRRPPMRPGMALKIAASEKGWIGINAPLVGSQAITSAGFVVDYFDYQPIVSVDPDSPAQRAGVLPGDELVAYNGIDLRGHRFNLTHVLAPDQRVVLTVRRDGETKDFPMIVAKAPEQVALRRRDFDDAPTGDLRIRTLISEDAQRLLSFGGTIIMATPDGRSSGNFTYRTMPAQEGVFGAKVLTLSPELAKKLKLEAGLLVDEVPEETPAYKAGLRTGDVILSASGQPVGSLRKLLELLMLRDADRSVNLVIVRDNKKRPLTVSW